VQPKEKARGGQSKLSRISMGSNPMRGHYSNESSPYVSARKKGSNKKKGEVDLKIKGEPLRISPTLQSSQGSIKEVIAPSMQ